MIMPYIKTILKHQNKHIMFLKDNVALKEERQISRTFMHFKDLTNPAGCCLPWPWGCPIPGGGRMGAPLFGLYRPRPLPRPRATS